VPVIVAANLYAIILHDGCLANLYGLVWATHLAVIFKFFG